MNEKKKHPELSPYGGRPPLTVEEVENLCNEIIEYAVREESLTLNGFCVKKRKSSGWALEIKKDYPKFSEAYEIAREIIGDRREILGLKKILSERIVDKTMPLYNKEYRELVLQLQKVQAENERIIQFMNCKKPEEKEDDGT